MKDVLRITGTAIITQKPDLLKRMTSCGKPAQLCIKITVEECFFHCGRAFNRSHIWVPEKWPESEQDFMHEQYVQKHNCTAQEAEEIAKRKQAVLDQLGETNGAY